MDIAGPNISVTWSTKGAKQVEANLNSIKSTSLLAATALRRINDTLKRIESKGLLGVQKQMQSTSTTSKQLETQVKKLQTANEKLAAQNRKLTDSQKKLDASTAKAGRGMRNLIPHVAAVTLSYMAMRKAQQAVSNAFKAGVDFEHQMALVGGIVRADAFDFDMLNDAARRAGETTVWAATESAQALRFLGMAGFSAAESVEALGGVLNLALIGELDLGRATDIATDTLRAFGLQASELDRVVDVMVGTITRSNTNIEKMGQALKYVAPVAAKLGYTVEEVSAMIGILSQSGIKAGIAGRALRMSFLKTMQAGKSLGIETTNLIEVLDELASRNMSAAELTTTLKDLFGIRSTPALLTLMQGREQLDTFIETLQNAQGETKEFVDRLDDVEVAWEKLKSVMVDVAISAFKTEATNLRDMLKEIAIAIRDNKDKIHDFFQGIIESGKELRDNMIPSLKLLVTQIKAIQDATSLQGTDTANILIYGVIGRFLFGTWGPAKIVAAMAIVDGAFHKMDLEGPMEQASAGWNKFYDYLRLVDKAVRNIPDILSGKRDWWTGLPEDTRELADELGVVKAILPELYFEFERLAKEAQESAEQVAKNFKAIQWEGGVPEGMFAWQDIVLPSNNGQKWNKEQAEMNEKWKQMRLDTLTEVGEAEWEFKEKLLKLDREYTNKSTELLEQFTEGPYKEYILKQANLIFETEAQKLNFVKAGSKEALEIIKQGQNKALAIIKSGLSKQKKEWAALYKFRRKNEDELAAQYEEENIDPKVFLNVLEWVEKDKVATIKAQREKLDAYKTYLSWIKGEYSTEYIAVSDEILRMEAEQLAKKLEDFGIQIDAEKLFTQMQMEENLKRLEALATYYAGIEGFKRQEIQALQAAAKLREQLNATKFGNPLAATTKGVQDALKPFDDLIKKQKELNKSSTFGDSMAQSINNVMESLTKLSDMYDKIPQQLRDIAEAQKVVDAMPDGKGREEAQKKVHEATMANIEAQLGAWRELFGTTKELFAENTKAREIAHKAEMAFAMLEIAMQMQKSVAIIAAYFSESTASVASATVQNAANSSTAITGAASSIAAQGTVPVAGFGLVAAMAALMAGVLAMGGIVSNFGSISGGGNVSELAKYTPGSTLLGGSKNDVSESLKNSFEMLEDINIEQYGKLIDIHRELQKLNSNITGLVTSIVRTGSVAGLRTPEGMGSPLAESVEKYVQITTLLGGGTFIDDLVGGIIGKISSFLFGGDVSYEILESGLQHFGYSLVHMGDVMSGISEVMIRPYLWYDQQTSGGLLGKDDSQYKTIYGDKSEDATRLITSIVKSIGKTMMDLVPLLGYGEETIQKIKDYAVALGTIDLKNLTPEQIGEALNAWFSNFADKMAEDVFGELLKRYQKVDEGLFETAVRLAVEKETILEVLDMTGQAFNGTALEAVHFSQALIEIAGDLNSLTEAAQSYFDEYATEAEKLVWLSNNLADAFNSIGVTMPETRQGFKDLIASIDLTTEEGADLYIMLLNIAGATDSYYDALESANEKIIEAQRKLTGTEDSGTIADIASRYGLKSSWIDDEWVKSIINKFTNATPSQIEEYAAAMGVSVDQLVDDILALAEIFNQAGDAASQASQSFSSLTKTIRDNIQAIQEQINKTLFLAGGGTEKQYYGNKLLEYKAQAEAAVAAGDMEDAMQALATGSSYLNSWYNAAVAEATAAAQEVANAERESLNSQRTILQEQLAVAQSFGNLVSQIDDVVKSIKYSGLNVSVPQQKAIAAQEDYNALKAAAMSGDIDAAQKFVSFASTYLQQQQNEFKSSGVYQDKYASVMSDLETLRNSAVALSYDEAILAELESINEAINNIEINVDLTAINDQFASMAGYLEMMVAKITTLNAIITIDWENWSGDQADALRMLLELVDQYGWDHEYTLKFLAEVPMDIFENLNDLARAAGWVADQSGGWNSEATISFIKNVAANWGFENINEILASAGYLAQVGGGWGAEVVVEFIATLMDKNNIELSSLPYWLDRMGLDSAQSMEFYVTYFASLLDPNQDPITQINTWLKSLGLEDTTYESKLKVRLVYEFYQSGAMSLSDVANHMHNMAVAAYDAPAYDPAAKGLVEQLQGLGELFGYNSAQPLGFAVGSASGQGGDGGLWPLMMTRQGMDYTWAEGGVITTPSLGWVAEAGYPEAIIPMKDGINIPVKWVNGGSTQAGVDRPIEINLSLEIDGEPLDAKIKVIARNESEDVRVNLVRWGKQDSPQRQSV